MQGEMTGLISLIAHPPEVLLSSNNQHRRLLAAIGSHDGMAAAHAMVEHLRGTEQVLGGLLPAGREAEGLVGAARAVAEGREAEGLVGAARAIDRPT
jgi:FCD domain